MEWITDRMPDEFESLFEKWYGTDKWNNAMWRKQSKEVLVTVEFEDGTRMTETSHTFDGQWYFNISSLKRKVVAWKPMPEPYYEN